MLPESNIVPAKTANTATSFRDKPSVVKQSVAKSPKKEVVEKSPQKAPVSDKSPRKNPEVG